MSEKLDTFQRQPLIVGNWKMSLLTEEAVKQASVLRDSLNGQTAVEVMLAPSFPSLSHVHNVVQGSGLRVVAQDMSVHESGAHTGEVAPDMLLTSGCTGVILGHSERRAQSSETDDLVGRKAVLALARGLFPIVCVGESASERESWNTSEVLERQLAGAFPSAIDDMICQQGYEFAVAYEPVWAIGSGKVATPEVAEESCLFIRKWLEERFNLKVATATRLLYGGSVKPNNSQELFQEKNIDGALVGGASLHAEMFYQIISLAPGFKKENTVK